MRKKGYLLFSIIATMMMGCSNTTPSKQNTSETGHQEKEGLIVGTFNIDIKAPDNDVNDQRKLLSDKDVEIFGIQEVDKNTLRYEQRANYDPFTDFTKEPYKDSFFGQSIEFGGGGYGNGIVSKYPLKETKVVELYGMETAPATEQKQFYAIYENFNYKDKTSSDLLMDIWGEDGLVTKGALEPRSYSRSIFEKDKKKIAFYSTHLSVESFEVRTKQLEQLKKVLDEDPTEYKILVGDFNTDHGINEFNIFSKDYQIANGHNGIWFETMAEKDVARDSLETSMAVKFLDNIIVSKNFEITNVEVIKTDLSDHYPLITTLQFK